MAFYTCQDVENDIFTSKSSFRPYIPMVPQISLEDHVPDIEKIERKKNNDTKFLPGEKLLIKLEKQKQKQKKKKGHKNNIDIERIQNSLTRVLKVF